MNLNELIMESIKTKLGGKKDQTSIQFGGSTEPGMKDQNVDSKNQADLEAGLKSDGASKEHKTPQGEAKTGLTPAQMSTKLGPAVVAGMLGANKKGIGAVDNKTPAVPDYKAPGPATK